MFLQTGGPGGQSVDRGRDHLCHLRVLHGELHKGPGRGLGMECKAGMMQRPERITLLVIGSLLGAIPVIGILPPQIGPSGPCPVHQLTAAYRIMFVKNRMVRDDQAK